MYSPLPPCYNKSKPFYRGPYLVLVVLVHWNHSHEWSESIRYSLTGCESKKCRRKETAYITALRACSNKWYGGLWGCYEWYGCLWGLVICIICIWTASRPIDARGGLVPIRQAEGFALYRGKIFFFFLLFTENDSHYWWDYVVWLHYMCIS